MPRVVLSSILVAVLTAVVTSLGLAAPMAAGARTAFPDRIELPDGFQPEGIAIGPGPTAWFGSLVDGDIYEVDLVTGDGAVVSQGPGTPSVGLKSDNRGRLFVAGGPSGSGRVVDTSSGEILETYQFTEGASFVNDVVLTKDIAWFTDSMNAELYGVPIARNGSLSDPSEVIHLPLTGEWTQTPGFNANGITQTPDGDALLVVQSSTGSLFRVDPATGDATQVDLGGTTLSNGDGMLLLGRTLYVVRNRDNLVAVIELDKTGTSGVLVDTLTSPDFDVPTTVARFGDSLYLPNARFGTATTPEYWATRITR